MYVTTGVVVCCLCHLVEITFDLRPNARASLQRSRLKVKLHLLFSRLVIQRHNLERGNLIINPEKTDRGASTVSDADKMHLLDNHCATC